MKNKFRQFMYGRYGYDQFNLFLLILYFILFVIETFLGLFGLRKSIVYLIINYLSLLVSIYFIYRAFSKQIYKRRAENNLYLKYTYSIRTAFNRYKNMWLYRKQYKYFKCPYCHKYSRVPRGRGKITITCPYCKKQFDKKS